MSTLDDAINAIKRGEQEEGRQILEQLLEKEENNQDVWLWLSTVVETDDDREICLENVLALNPDHEVAQKSLDALRSGEFDPSEIVGDVPQEPGPEITFHDEFFRAADELDSDELEMPSVMGGSPEPKIKQKKQQASKSKGLNLRVILLAAVGLFVCVALGGVVAYSFLIAGGEDTSTPAEVQPARETPQGTEPDASAGTPAPEETPTPTNTPLLLPTSKPTDEPTPTATQVVSPTPPQPTEDETDGDG